MHIILDLINCLWIILTHGSVIAWLTLAVTIIGICFAKKAYKYQVSMVEPWSLTNIEGNLWQLERTKAKLATISGVNIDNFHSECLIQWHKTGSGFPSGYYRKGTKLLMEIEGIITGAQFTLSYEEPKKEKYPLKHSCDTNFQQGIVSSKRTIIWSDTLYSLNSINSQTNQILLSSTNNNRPSLKRLIIKILKGKNRNLM